jgi:hypothetical protein
MYVFKKKDEGVNYICIFHVIAFSFSTVQHPKTTLQLFLTFTIPLNYCMYNIFCICICCIVSVTSGCIEKQINEMMML